MEALLFSSVCILTPPPGNVQSCQLVGSGWIGGGRTINKLESFVSRHSWMLQDGSWLAWRKITHYSSYPRHLLKINFTYLLRHSLCLVSSEMFPWVLFSLPLHMVRNRLSGSKVICSITVITYSYITTVYFLYVRKCEFYSLKPLKRNTKNALTMNLHSYVFLLL